LEIVLAIPYIFKYTVQSIVVFHSLLISKETKLTFNTTKSVCFGKQFYVTE